MQERIQKIISAAGVTSRRAAEELITEGRVRVNGAVVTELGAKADPSKDHIKVDGKLINPKQPQTYIMLNKPTGFVTTMSDPEGRPTVQDLLKGVKVRVYPVGRLDYNTEGLLLLTNDGDFAHLITHPKHEFPKTYLAKVKGVLEDSQIDTLEKGIYLDDGKTAPAKIKKIRKEEMNSWLEITIHEGRKRQVRRMFDRVGRSVIRLKRIRTGNLVLGDLPEGTFRYLTSEEVKGLKELAVKERKPEIRIQKPEVGKKEGPVSAVKGHGATGGDARRATSAGRQRPDEGRVRGPVMQDTGDGRRKNQVVRPGTRSDYSGSKGLSAAPGFGPRSDRSSRPATRSATSRPTTRAGVGRPAPGAAMGNRETRRIPAQRSWAGARSSESRSKGSGYETREEGRRPASGPRPNRSAFTGSKGPGGTAGFGPRGDSTYSPTSRPATSRPTTRAGVGRPAPGAATGRPETRRKPEPRSWPGARSSDSRSKSPGYEPREGGRRPSSGPRPNRSTFTGGKGPGRGTKPGSRGPGQGASNRGPRR